MMGTQELFFCQGRTRGTGSNKNSAWEQAIMGVGEELYPLVADVGLTLSEKMNLAEFMDTLNELDGNLWKVSQALDPDRILELIERQIIELEG